MTQAATRARPRASAPEKTKDQDKGVTLAALQRQINELAAENKALRALAPVSRTSGMVEALDHPVGAAGDVHMETTGAPALMRPEVEVETRMPPLALMDELKFMEELIQVEVHPANEQYPEPCISVWNDGRHQLFIRGHKQIVKRKFVEVLARSKPITYQNVEYVDEQGNRRVKYPMRTNLRFPFVVLRDANPRGAEWLKKVLAQA
jgi:hypothetical protein